MQISEFAWRMTLRSDGSRMAMSSAMMVATTNISTNVNAVGRLLITRPYAALEMTMPGFGAAHPMCQEDNEEALSTLTRSQYPNSTTLIVCPATRQGKTSNLLTYVIGR